MILNMETIILILIPTPATLTDCAPLALTVPVPCKSVEAPPTGSVVGANVVLVSVELPVVLVEIVVDETIVTIVILVGADVVGAWVGLTPVGAAVVALDVALVGAEVVGASVVTLDVALVGAEVVGVVVGATVALDGPVGAFVVALPVALVGGTNVALLIGAPPVLPHPGKNVTMERAEHTILGWDVIRLAAINDSNAEEIESKLELPLVCICTNISAILGYGPVQLFSNPVRSGTRAQPTASSRGPVSPNV
jgi:hypothetical protein